MHICVLQLTGNETDTIRNAAEYILSRDERFKGQKFEAPCRFFVYILNAPYISALLVTVLDVLNSKDLGVVCQPCGCVDGILGTLGST